MKLGMTTDMRLEQRMKLAPRMIQSMEILQLPLMALEERIEAEINSNPVLEVEEPAAESQAETQTESRETLSDPDGGGLDEFERLARVGEDYREYLDRGTALPRKYSSDEADAKMEAMQNTAAPQCSLRDHLLEQWGLVEASPGVKNAGLAIIDYIDDRGYLSVRLEQLYNKDKSDFAPDDLPAALELVQQLEPAGVGARDIRECLLIQMRQEPEEYQFEIRLVSEHMDELLENRLPEITRRMDCSMDRLKTAIGRLSKFDTSPGLLIGPDRNLAVTADVIIERDESGEYNVRLSDWRLPELRINSSYATMAANKSTDENTRKFLRNHIRSARWIMEAIEQRKETLLKVARSIVAHQKEFFDKGPLYLKPLPMSRVADEIGVHVATVSRAVAGKYGQCPQGILPLRNFFTGGTEDASGNATSWDAIRARLQQIIDEEDKTRPLNDEQIRQKLHDAGFADIARRTVAKYRGLAGIPAAKYRKRF